MTFKERLELTVEVAGDTAKSWWQGFRDEVSAAEGPLGKVKAAGAGMMDGLKNNAMPILAGAGAGIAAFALDAAGKFQSAALDAKALADTMGTSIENGSRLNAIFKPLGIEVGDAADVFNNLAGMIASGDTALSDLGVTIAKDKDGRTDLNETFIRIVENVGKIEDPAQRAAAAAKLFGEEGARQFLPLIEQSDQLRKNLADVSDQKVIDEDELAKAEKMRDTQRAIEGILQDVTMQVGELAAELAPAVELGAKLTGWLVKLGDTKIPFTNGEMDLWTGGLTGILNTSVSIDSKMADLKWSTADWGAAAVAAAREAKEGQDAAAEAIDGVKDAHELAADAAAEQARRVVEQDMAYQGLFGTLDRTDALLNLGQQFDDTRAKIADAYTAWETGAADADQKTREAWQSQNDLKRSVAEYAQEVLKLPAERTTTLLAKIDQGEADYVEQYLNDIARYREVAMVPSVYDPNGQVKHGNGYAYAAGTYPDLPHPGGRARVGEHGPEDLYLPPGTMVAPNHDPGRFGGGDTYVTIYAPAGYSADDIAEAQRRWARRNG